MKESERKGQGQGITDTHTHDTTEPKTERMMRCKAFDMMLDLFFLLELDRTSCTSEVQLRHFGTTHEFERGVFDRSHAAMMTQFLKNHAMLECWKASTVA